MDALNCARDVAGTAKITSASNKYWIERSVRILFTPFLIILRLPGLALLLWVARMYRRLDVRIMTQGRFENCLIWGTSGRFSRTCDPAETANQALEMRQRGTDRREGAAGLAFSGWTCFNNN